MWIYVFMAFKGRRNRSALLFYFIAGSIVFWMYSQKKKKIYTKNFYNDTEISRHLKIFEILITNQGN